jgi:hypothetical protein
LLKERFAERLNIRFGSCDRCYHSSTPGAHRITRGEPPKRDQQRTTTETAAR